MIRVLFVAPELAPWKKGGVSNAIQKLANAMADSDEVKLTLLGTVARGCRPSPPDYNERIEFILIEKPEVPEPLYHIRLQTRYRSAVKSWLRDNPDGLIHFHILPGARALLAAAAALQARARVVLTVYDLAPLEARYHDQPLGHRAHWWLARLLLGRFRQLVVNSQYISDEVRRFAPRAAITVIPNGITLRDWEMNAPPPVAEGSPHLLYWGQLWEKKGVGILLEAFALLREKGLRDARLSIAGEGEQTDRLRRLAGDLSLNGSVKFLGAVDHQVLRELVHSCDVAVFPSVYEGFGIAILEAMCCGRPVVTTALGGPREFISNGVDGVLVAERNPASLADSLEQLARQPDLARRIGEKARDKALKFEWRYVAPRYVDLYRSIAHGSHPRD